MPPARWRNWYPHQIDAWRGSMTVQGMSDGAYRGYHNLLMSQWQSEDGSLPDDDGLLARSSGLFSRWKKFRKEILENFESRDGRLWNTRQKDEWDRAKEVAEKKGRHSPESGQSVDTVRPESDQSQTRVSTHARVCTNTTTITETKEEQTIGPDMVASAVLETLSLSGKWLRGILTDVARSEIKKGKAPELIRDAMCDAWTAYQLARSKDELSYASGADKFFGEGLWSNMAAWPRKENGNGHYESKDARRERETLEILARREAERAQ